MPRRVDDPYAAFNYLVEIDGITSAGFSECSGLDTETDVIDYREGNDEITVHKQPGLKKFSNITLKRGFTDNTELWEWRLKVMDGDVERKNVSIVLLDEAKTEKLRWNLKDAWPSKWTGPDLKASSSDIAIETLEFCHEGAAKA